MTDYKSERPLAIDAIEDLTFEKPEPVTEKYVVIQEKINSVRLPLHLKLLLCLTVIIMHCE